MSRAPRPAGRAPPPIRASQTVLASSGAISSSTPSSPVYPVPQTSVGAPATGSCAVLKRGAFPVGEALDDLARLRALDGQHRVGLDPIADLHLEFDGVRLEPLEVALVIRRVGHGQIAVLAEPVGEEVIENPAVLAAEAGMYAPR